MRACVQNLRRDLIRLVPLLLLIPQLMGCSICCSPDYENYAAYGGAWQRDDMQHGRAGSVLAPAGFPADGEMAIVEPRRNEPRRRPNQYLDEDPGQQSDPKLGPQISVPQR